DASILRRLVWPTQQVRHAPDETDFLAEVVHCFPCFRLACRCLVLRLREQFANPGAITTDDCVLDLQVKICIDHRSSTSLYETFPFAADLQLELARRDASASIPFVDGARNYPNALRHRCAQPAVLRRYAL